MTDTTAQQELAHIQERLTDLRGRRADLLRADNVDDKNVRIRMFDGGIASLHERQAELLRQVAGNGNGHVPGYAGDTFLSNPETIDQLAHMASSKMPIGRVNLGPYASREQAVNLTGRALAAAGDLTPSTGMGRGPFYGVVPPLQPPLTFLDLIPTVPMDWGVVPYARETGDMSSSAGTVVPGDLKPAATVGYVDDEAHARTIAHWVKVQKQTLTDVPNLQSAITSRLMYGVLRRVEAQVIAGDGTGENFTGILNTSGVAVVAYSASELAADQALSGIVNGLLAGARPNVVAMNPVDWGKVLKAKAQLSAGPPPVGSGEYLGMGPFVSSAQSMWGCSFVPAVGVPAGTALVGDTVLGATLMVREGVNVLVSDADTDDFTRNRVTLLAEGRWALAVWSPLAWCIVHLAP